MMSEKVELIGKGLYTNIPDQLTLSSMPTVSELDYVGSEDFKATMLDKILPQSVEEKINFRELYEFDFYWLCRCLRFLNYGPYFTANSIYCPECNQVSRGEYTVDLRGVDCKAIPEGFSFTDLKVSKDEFIEYDKDITLKFLTIQEGINYENDKAFSSKNQAFARVCYSIKMIGDAGVTPIEAKIEIESKMSPADYNILRIRANELLDYGLRLGGSTTCPNCGSKEATFVALVDDRFLRPTLGDLKQWKSDRSRGADENSSGSKAATVRKHS